MAQRLTNLNIKTIYSSPLKRAGATAEIIQKSISSDIIFLDEMKEVRLGQWEGFSSNQLRETNKTDFYDWETNPECTIGFGVENYKSLQDRAYSTFKNICDKGEQALLVGHGTWTRALVCKILNIPFKDRMNFELNNTGISTFDISNGKTTLVTLNDKSHI